MRKKISYISSMMLCSIVLFCQDVNASPFYSDGQFTENGIEWCEENFSLYQVLGEKFFEHFKYSIESRVCANLYQDYYWTYDGADRIEKLIERSKYYSQLEILESYEESKTGIIDTAPADNKDQTLMKGITEDGQTTVQIISSTPKMNQSMEVNLAFIDKYGDLLTGVNYGIKITQNEQIILDNNNIFSEKGISTLTTRPLDSEEPVSIKISLKGNGTSANQEGLTESNDEVLIFNVVPEFGSSTTFLLALTIFVMIFVTSKTRIMKKINFLYKFQ